MTAQIPVSTLHACSCPFLTGSPELRTTDLSPTHNVWFNWFYRSNTKKNPWKTTSETLLCPPRRFMITSGLFHDEQYFRNKSRGLTMSNFTWALHSWKAETVKKFLFSFVSYSEIRPSVPFPRSLVKLTDAWTCLCNSSSLFPFLSEFLFNKYSPYAIACNKIISLIVPLILSLTEQQQEPYHSPEVPLMQHFPYNGNFLRFYRHSMNGF